MHNPTCLERQGSLTCSVPPRQSIIGRNPAKVRAQLHDILAEARSAKVLPWEPRRVALYRTIVPQMANWLPSEEARQLCFEFEAELVRLEAA